MVSSVLQRLWWRVVSEKLQRRAGGKGVPLEVWISGGSGRGFLRLYWVSLWKQQTGRTVSVRRALLCCQVGGWCPTCVDVYFQPHSVRHTEERKWGNIPDLSQTSLPPSFHLSFSLPSTPYLLPSFPRVVYSLPIISPALIRPPAAISAPTAGVLPPLLFPTLHIVVHHFSIVKNSQVIRDLWFPSSSSPKNVSSVMYVSVDIIFSRIFKLEVNFAWCFYNTGKNWELSSVMSSYALKLWRCLCNFFKVLYRLEQRWRFILL